MLYSCSRQYLFICGHEVPEERLGTPEGDHVVDSDLGGPYRWQGVHTQSSLQ